MTLLHRIETAPEPSRDLFEETYDALLYAWQGGNNYARFTATLDAQAWTSAAEMLVRDDWPRTTSDHRGLLGLEASATVTANPAGHIKKFESRAAHPALALLAAILKANGYE